jgi:hypothetical protein
MERLTNLLHDSAHELHPLVLMARAAENANELQQVYALARLLMTIFSMLHSEII